MRLVSVTDFLRHASEDKSLFSMSCWRATLWWLFLFGIIKVMEEEKGQFNKFVLSLYEDNGGPVRFLNGILLKATEFVRHFDAQTNILVGIASAIFLFVLSVAAREESVDFSLLVLGIFAGLSALTSLYAIHPPRFMRKKRQEESLMYNKKVANFPTHIEYKEELRKVMENREEVLDQYSIEIYNLYKYYYRPKRKLFRVL